MTAWPELRIADWRDLEGAILAFAESAYNVGATLAGWVRAAFAYPTEGAPS